MTDTLREGDAAFTELFRNVSGSDRVKMACEMFDMARRLMMADIKAREPGITAVELRVRVFERMYSSDFTPDESLASSPIFADTMPRIRFRTGQNERWPGPGVDGASRDQG